MTLPTPVGTEDGVAAFTRKRRRLRLILISLTVVAASAMLAWGYLGYFTDVLVLRETPIQTLASPSGVRELRVYDVAAGGEHKGVWLATVAPASGSDAEQRKVYYGNEVTFSWLDDVTLLAREYPTNMPGVEHRIDVIHDSYGRIFQEMARRGLAALQKKYPDHEVEVLGMGWVQGESDALDGKGAGIQRHLTAFIADVRATFGTNLVFALSKISPNQIEGNANAGKLRQWDWSAPRRTPSPLPCRGLSPQKPPGAYMRCRKVWRKANCISPRPPCCRSAATSGSHSSRPADWKTSPRPPNAKISHRDQPQRPAINRARRPLGESDDQQCRSIIMETASRRDFLKRLGWGAAGAALTFPMLGKSAPSTFQPLEKTAGAKPNFVLILADARGVGRVWEGLDETLREDDYLGALLGRGRAAVLTLLRTPMSTTTRRDADAPGRRYTWPAGRRRAQAFQLGRCGGPTFPRFREIVGPPGTNR